jgi:putative FmdB family regulatory protein
MPIYEYRCADCGRVTSVLVRGFNVTVEPRCSRCNGTSLRKLVSRFSVAKSEESRLEGLSDMGQFADVDEDDPKSVAKWARKLGSEMGEDLGDDFREAIDQMEAGELPSEAGEGGGEGDFGGSDDL